MREKANKFFFNSNVWTAAAAVLLLALIVFPMVYIAQYIWPCSDDFEMSLCCKEIWEETGSFWQVIGRAVQYAAYYWGEWEGTFASLILMALQPGIWGDQYYWLGVVFLFVSLIGSTFTLAYVLMVKQAKAPKSVWITITSAILFIWLMRVMYTEEAFYWWTGASNYIGFHSWVMLVCALAACIYTDYESYHVWKRRLLYLVCGVCFFLGGGNYLSALLQVLVLAGYLTAAVITKRKNKTIFAAYLLSALTALLLSALAPGNSLHIDFVLEEKISAFDAVLIAIRDGLKNIYVWTHLQQILLFLLLLPFVWTMARSSGCRFRLPLLATILSGGLYLAQYTPCSYSYGGFEPGRIINLYYWNYYWLILFNLFYWTGWLDRMARKRNWGGRLAERQNKWQPFYVIVIGLLFVWNMGLGGLRDSNMGWVYAELLTGKYKLVDEFMEERISYFEQHKGEDVAVEEIPYKSYITYFADVFPGRDNDVNTAMAEYYGLKSVTLK